MGRRVWEMVGDAFVARRRRNEVSGSTRIGVGVSDDLVVVRHHGSVSGRVCERSE